MKKIAVITSVIILLASSRIALAQEAVLISENTDSQIVTLGANQTHQGDYFAAGENVIISGTVKGDVYAAGSQVIIDGTVEGDILASGGTVTIKGIVNQDVRVAGGQVMIGGEIKKNLTLMGGNLVIASDAKIGGNVVAAGGNLVINAQIPGNLKAGVGNLMITANVGGNADVAVGQLTLTPKVAIKGDLTYKSDQKALIAGEATVSGKITRLTYTPDQDQKLSASILTLESFKQKFSESLARVFTALFWVSLLGSLVVGFLLVHFFPNFTYDAITTIEDHSWKTLGVGLLTLFIAPILIILVLVTVIGLPLGIIFTAYYSIILYLGRIIFAYWLGARFIHRLARIAGKGVTLAVGLFLFYLLGAITYFGPILTLSALFWGVGAIVLAEKKAYLSARRVKLI